MPRWGFVLERSLWSGRTPAQGREARLGLLHCLCPRKLEVRAALCVLGVRRDTDPVEEGGGLVPGGDSRISDRISLLRPFRRDSELMLTAPLALDHVLRKSADDSKSLT